MTLASQEGRFLIKLLTKVCTTVNKGNSKSFKSYAVANKFLRDAGFTSSSLIYVTSYRYESELVDLYEFTGGSAKIYATDKEVYGCEILNPPYACIKHLQKELKGYSVLQTYNGILCEKIFKEDLRDGEVEVSSGV